MSARSLRLVYFAWVRERIGRTDEVVEVPEGVATVDDLVAWLVSRGEEYAYAFEHRHVVRAAIDKVHARPGAALREAKEVAFFPPMTGG